MTNAFYNVSAAPVAQSRGASGLIRSEFASIAAGFELLPTVVQLFSDSANYSIDTGTANAYQITVNPAIVSIAVDGLTFRFRALNANTGASTLNSIALVRPDGTVLQANDIVPGPVVVTYDAAKGKFTVALSGGPTGATGPAANVLTNTTTLAQVQAVALCF